MAPYLFVSTYNRIEYVAQSLHSLKDSFVDCYPELYVTDDGSTDPKVELILQKLKESYSTWGKCHINLRKHEGIPYGKLNPIKDCITKDYPHSFFLISDSDMIYKKGWLDFLIKLYDSTKMPVITAFNTETNNHTTVKEFTSFRLKSSIGGANMLIDTQFYLEHPFDEPVSWDYHMCERAHAYTREGMNSGVISSRPSLVQHIGVKGHWAREDYHDVATDF